jgi:hypothetical protein
VQSPLRTCDLLVITDGNRRFHDHCCSFYCSSRWRFVDGFVLGLKSSTPSSSAVAESRIVRNRLRRWTALDSEEVFVVVVGRTGDSTLLLENAGLVVVLLVCDGDFMVVVVMVDKGVVAWHATH